MHEGNVTANASRKIARWSDGLVVAFVVCCHARASVHVPCVCVCVHFASSCDQEFTTLIFLAGGRRGCRGAPPLQPRKAHLHRLRLGPVVGSWRGTHLRSPFISFRATSFLCVWRSKGQKPYPWRIISFRFGCHSWCLACVAQNFPLISALSLRALLHFRYQHHYQHHRVSSCVTLSREKLSRSADNTISVYYNGFPSRRRSGLHWRQASLKGIRLRPSGTHSLSLSLCLSLSLSLSLSQEFPPK